MTKPSPKFTNADFPRSQPGNSRLDFDSSQRFLSCLLSLPARPEVHDPHLTPDALEYHDGPHGDVRHVHEVDGTIRPLAKGEEVEGAIVIRRFSADKLDLW
jgi:hypothetical protein